MFYILSNTIYINRAGQLVRARVSAMAWLIPSYAASRETGSQEEDKSISASSRFRVTTYLMHIHVLVTELEEQKKIAVCVVRWRRSIRPSPSCSTRAHGTHRIRYLVFV